MIITCPVGNYYKEGLKPVKIAIEEHDVRAIRGGTVIARLAVTTQQATEQSMLQKKTALHRFSGLMVFTRNISKRLAQ